MLETSGSSSNLDDLVALEGTDGGDYVVGSDMEIGGVEGGGIGVMGDAETDALDGAALLADVASASLQGSGVMRSSKRRRVTKGKR